ncbi:MAG: cyclic lactone autoinducer peptide [Oscillospiraceae bacterium]|nr:cyclic lactone autoinducer peptide [Oscillospiraceae bacterium]
MKSKILSKISGMIACLALMATVLNVNAVCQFFFHQPELPQNAKKLRRF